MTRQILYTLFQDFNRDVTCLPIIKAPNNFTYLFLVTGAEFTKFTLSHTLNNIYTCSKLKVHTEIGQNFQHFCLITKSHRHAIILTSAKFRHPLVRVSTTNLIIKLGSLEEVQHTTAYLLSFHYYIVYICIATLILCSRNHDTFVLPVNTDH